MQLTFLACVPVVISLLFSNLEYVQAQYFSRSFDNANAFKPDSISDEDLVNFLEDLYADEKIKSFRDQEESLEDDRGRQTPKPTILDYVKYVPDSKDSLDRWNDEDLYELLDFISNENANELNDYEPFIDSDATSYPDNKDVDEQRLLETEILEDILDNAKLGQDSKLDDLDLEDFFEEEMKKESEKEDDESSDDKVVSKPVQDEIEETESLKTSDGKKERDQKEADVEKDNETTQSEEEAAVINTKSENEVDENKEDLEIDQDDVDELRSLLTEMTDSKNSESSKVADTEEESDSKTEKKSVSTKKSDEIKVNIEFPGISISEDDTYLCTSVKISDYTNSTKAIQIVEYIPHARQSVAHHIVLYGCEFPGIKTPGAVWNCGGAMTNIKKPKSGYKNGQICGFGAKQIILWAWAKDAPDFKLPKNVGFKVSGDTKINSLVLQVHYKTAAIFRGGRKDHTSVEVVMSTTPRPRLAGIYVFGTVAGTVPPYSYQNFDIICKYKQPFTVHPFAFRTHTHALGVEVLAYRIRDGVWTLIGAKNPQLPEAFYPVATKNMTVRYNDMLAARCEYKSFRSTPTKIGFRHTDEMCNFYFMFWVDAKYESELGEFSNSCFSGFPTISWSTLPGYND